jgi:pimeloyl-ACP methyl ester carboxylesterase
LRTFLKAAACLFALSAAAAERPVDPPEDPSLRCGALAGLPIPGTALETASLVADRPDLPAFCQMEGRIAERVEFILRLPARDWNGKFAVAGCGGFCGSLRPDKPGHSNSMNESLKLGYAAIQTDGGHQAESWDTDWAIGDDRALALYAGAWMPLAVATGRALIEAYYADTPRRTYFSGCSNGGRLGLFAAQRYPELFDGIAAGGAIFDLTGNSAIHGLWLLQTTRDERGRAVIDRDKLPLLEQHVMGQCDDLDGVADGVVSRPTLCRPQPEALQCDGKDAARCFTPAEVRAIRRLYQGATVDGRQLFPGIPPGSERLWSTWIVGSDDERAWGERAAQGTLRLTYGIPGSMPFNPHDYDFGEELVNLRRLSPVLDATDPDLSGLARAGGKLFYYHGLADPLILEGRVRQYYAEAAAVVGEEQLRRFARFVLVPGQGHCWEQPGQVADEFNPLAVIDRWVESGEAPDEVIADYTGEGRPRSAKLCPYPGFARFQGGDAARAESFRCK